MPSATRGSFEKPPLDPAKLLTKGTKPLRVLKELCRMSGQLSEIIIKTTDKDELNQLIEKYIKISELIGKTGKIQFNENDKYYRNTIKKFKDTEKEFKQFAANQIEIMDLFKSITDIIANVEKLFNIWDLIHAK